nr:MAG TPA: hypothetical protein [Caudoviricetes sp.]
MATIPVNYNQAYELKQKYFPDLSNEEAAEALSVASQNPADPDTKFDFSSLETASSLVRGRAAINRALTGGYQEYAAPLVSAALGEGAVGRVANRIGEGITSSIPEVAALVLTHGKDKGLISRMFGKAVAGVGAHSNVLAETGDPTSAMTAGLTMGVTPSIAGGLTRAFSKLPVVASSPTATNVLAGLATTALTSPADIALSPRASAHSSPLGDIRSYERVSPSDTEAMAERFNALTGEDLATIVGSSIVPDTIIGAQMARSRKAVKLDDAARQAIQSATAETKDFRKVLSDYGIPTPQGANEIDITNAYNRLITEGGASQLDIIKQLYQSVDQAKLSPAERAFKERLESNTLNADDIQFMGDQAKPIENPFIEQALKDFDRMVVDTDLTDYAPEKANKAAQAFGKVTRFLSNAHQATESIPAAREVIDTYAQQKPKADEAVSRALDYFGQGEEGGKSLKDSYNNLTRLVSEADLNPELNKKYSDTLYKLNEMLYKTETNPETGETIRHRLTMFDQLPTLSVEEIQKLAGLNRDQATFVKRIVSSPIENAKLDLNASSATAQMITAEQLRNAFPTIKDSASALRLSTELYKQARPEVLNAMRAEHVGGGNEPSKIAIQRLSDFIQNTVYSHVKNKSLIKGQADSLAAAIFYNEKALLKSYQYNSMFGYSSLSRKGEKYGLFYKDIQGNPYYESFKDKVALEARQKALKANKEINPESLEPIDKSQIDLSKYDHIADIQAKNFQDEIRTARAELRDYLIKNGNRVFDIDPDGILAELAQREDNFFKVAQSLVSKANLETRTSIARKMVKGATGSEIITNALEAAQRAARRSSYIADNAKIDYLMKDPMIKNNPEMLDFLEQKRRYMQDPNISEWAGIRAYATLYYLLGSGSYIAANLLQVPTLGMSVWRQATGRSIADFGSSLRKAITVVNDYDRPVSRKQSALDKELFPYLKALEERKVFDQHYTEDVESMRKLTRTLGDVLDKTPIFQRVMRSDKDIMHWLTQVITGIETQNRKMAATAYLISENNNKPLASRSRGEIEQVLTNAAKFSRDINFSGGKAQRAQIFQKLAGSKITHGGALLGMTLQNYAANLGGLIANQLKKSIPGLESKHTIASKSYKQNYDRLGFAKTMAIITILAGTSGIPGSDIIDTIAKKLLGDDFNAKEIIPNLGGNAVEAVLDYLIDDETADPEWTEQKRNIRNKFVDALQYGLPSLGGIVFQNLGLSSIGPVNIFDNPSLWDLTGAVGQVATRNYKLLQGLVSGDSNLVKTNLPTALNQLRNFSTLETTGTVYNKKGEPVSTPDGGSGVGRSLAALVSGSPLEVTKRREAAWRQKGIERKAAEGRRRLLGVAVSAVEDPERLQAIYEHGVKKGFIVDDPLKFSLDVGEILAKREGAYTDKPSALTAERVAEIQKRYGVAPAYVGQVHKLERAIEVATALADPTALNTLMERLFKSDFEKDYWTERGVPADVIATFKKVGLPLTEEILSGFLSTK